MRGNQRNKYGVRLDPAGKSLRTADGILFASKREHDRYLELKLLKLAGEIRGLELQPEFELWVDHRHICNYRGDFLYYDKLNKRICEDAKGYHTAESKLKWKVVKAMLRYRDTEFRLV